MDFCKDQYHTVKSCKCGVQWRLDLEYAKLVKKVLELFVVSSLGAGGWRRCSRSAVVAETCININILLLYYKL